MNDNLTQFESLPNEIFIEIFQYFNGQILFQTFYNLNLRFNTLLQSLNNLYLLLTPSNCIEIHHYDYIAPYIDILSIYGRVQINLNYFINIRHLILRQAANELVEQLEMNHLPYLEYLFILGVDRIGRDSMPSLWNKIFSNGFPYLKSCCTYKLGLITLNPSWTQVLSLRILKIGDIDIFVYKSILSTCSNLFFLKFTKLISNNKSSDIVRHINLKKLVLVIPWFEQLPEDCDMNNYFSCVPNLEQVTNHRTDESKNLDKSFLEFDWYAELFGLYLPLLSRFNYYFHILESDGINFSTPVILNQIQEHFNRVHHRLDQCRFIIDLIGYSNFNE